MEVISGGSYFWALSEAAPPALPTTSRPSSAPALPTPRRPLAPWQDTGQEARPSRQPRRGARGRAGPGRAAGARTPQGDSTRGALRGRAAPAGSPQPRSRLPPPRSRTPGPAGSRGGSAGPALTTMQGLGVAMARPAGAGAGAGAAAGGDERRGAGRRRAPQRPRRRLPRSPPSTWPRRRRPLRPGPGPCEEPPGRRARPPPAARLRELGTHRPWRRVQAAVGAFALRKGTGTRVGRGPLQPVTSGRVGEVSH